MNAVDFVEALIKATPSPAELKNIATPKVIIDMWENWYNCVPRKKTIRIDEMDNEISKLYEKWSMGTVEIGMLGFNDELSFEEDYVIFGRIESDPVVLNRKSGLIYVLEYNSNDHKLWDVAEEAEKFLGAMAIVAQRMRNVSLKLIDPNDDNLSKECARVCAKEAGGDKFLNFYLMLFGC